MPDQEFRAYIQTLAQKFAATHYEKTHPGRPEREAWAWAVRNWRNFLDQAFDLAALLECARQAEAAARQRVN